MSILKRIAILTVLLTGIAAYSFADVLYNMTAGIFRVSEEFKDEEYCRDLNGVNLNMGLYLYPGSSPLGLYFSASIGALVSAYEWYEDDMDSVDFYSAEEIKFCLGPSIRLNSKGKIFFPISAGAAVSNYREENYSYDYDSDSDTTKSNSSFYEALTLGAFGDIGIVVNPSKLLTLNSGISVAYNFLRLERGRLQSDIRNTFNREFTNVNYGAYAINFYMGIGMRFNNAKDKKRDKQN